MAFPIFFQFHKKYIFLLCCRLSLHFYLFHKKNKIQEILVLPFIATHLPFHFSKKNTLFLMSSFIMTFHVKKNYFRNPDATVLRNISISMSFLDQRLVIIILLVLNWLLILIFLPLKLVNPLSGFSLLSSTGF